MKNTAETCQSGIPMPIVRLNRSVIVLGVLLAVVTQTPLITTALFAIILPAALFGRRASLIYAIGSRVFAKQNARAEIEHAKLARFNNSIAAILLGGAQLAFLAGAPLAGYSLSVMVATAALVALLGFCLGCFLYFQLNMRLRRAR